MNPPNAIDFWTQTVLLILRAMCFSKTTNRLARLDLDAIEILDLITPREIRARFGCIIMEVLELLIKHDRVLSISLHAVSLTFS